MGGVPDNFPHDYKSSYCRSLLTNGVYLVNKMKYLFIAYILKTNVQYLLHIQFTSFLVEFITDFAHITQNIICEFVLDIIWTKHKINVPICESVCVCVCGFKIVRDKQSYYHHDSLQNI